jgi:hypothetical protein
MLLLNARRFLIPEMDQMIEIMHFSVSIVVMRVFGTPSLDAAHTAEWGYSKTSHDSPGQAIHKVRCLAVLQFFKKLMWHTNS